MNKSLNEGTSNLFYRQITFGKVVAPVDSPLRLTREFYSFIFTHLFKKAFVFIRLLE